MCQTFLDEPVYSIRCINYSFLLLYNLADYTLAYVYTYCTAYTFVSLYLRTLQEYSVVGDDIIMNA